MRWDSRFAAIKISLRYSSFFPYAYWWSISTRHNSLTRSSIDRSAQLMCKLAAHLYIEIQLCRQTLSQLIHASLFHSTGIMSDHHSAWMWVGWQKYGLSLKYYWNILVKCGNIIAQKVIHHLFLISLQLHQFSGPLQIYMYRSRWCFTLWFWLSFVRNSAHTKACYIIY